MRLTKLDCLANHRLDIVTRYLTHHHAPKITCAITVTAITLTFFRKLIKYFMYFHMKFALFFRFFDSWYIIKYLLTETSGKQC